MSISSEIARIGQAKTDIATAIEGKGVAVPNGTMIDGMATLINEIDSDSREIKEAASITLTSGGWANKRQTVSHIGVDADSIVIVSPAPSEDNFNAYTESGVCCEAQGEDTLTFVCEEVPDTDLVVNVVVFNYRTLDEVNDDLTDITEGLEAANRELAELQEALDNIETPTVTGGTAYNLLDNSDFTQFVAQAGIGGKHGTQSYAGDRWILSSGTVTGTANGNGSYKSITLNGTIRQKVACPPAVGVAGVEMVSGSADISYSNGEVTITSNGGVIKNAGLYEGETLPPYQPKGYGVELQECMRYFLSISTALVTYGGLGQIDFPVQMRTSPTISVSSWGGYTLSVAYKSIWGCCLSGFASAVATNGITLTALADL